MIGELFMAEIGEPIRRRILIPQTVPDEPLVTPLPKPMPPVHEPEKVEPEKVP